MAVEIIVQCGNKNFWEEHEDDKKRMQNVYRYVLSRLQEYLPDFKVANAVIHFDEASPHMHVVTNENQILRKENKILRDDNARLKSIINNDSSNTSLPPSSDQKGGKAANTYNGRKKTERKAGGQKGHKGTTLSKSEVEEKLNQENVPIKS